ncbi:MAG TPA: hypothetical protein VGQ48_03920 [Gemmatimonadales bacterium]|jgi:hypothetical protein|nr:hypothetical protein [Gemmatimonadales bacterium]
MHRFPILALVCSLLGSGVAAAQVCSGDMSFAGGPVHLGFGIALNSNAEAYHSGFALGNANVFGSAEVGLSTYNAGGNAWDFGAGFGMQTTRRHDSKLQVCPEVFLGATSGPKDINGSGINYSARHFSFGADAGYVAVDHKDIQFLPTASLLVVVSRSTLSGPSSASNTDYETFGLIVFGASLGFDHQVALHPVVAFPVGLKGATTSYGVSFSINLSGKP